MSQKNYIGVTMLTISLLLFMPLQLLSQKNRYTPKEAEVKKPVLAGTERVKLFMAQEKMRDSSAFKDLHWQYIGPTNISGRCTDVEAVSPRGSNYVIWVGSATGGVWKSVDRKSVV